MRFSAAFDWLARWLTGASTVVLSAMMMVTVADVVMRQTVNVPLFGVFDLVEFFLVLMTFLAMPEIFLREEQLVIDIVDRVVGDRVKNALRVMASALGLVLLVQMLRQMIVPALDTMEFNDQTMDLAMPKIWHWSVILLGVACSIIAVALIIVRDIARLMGAPEAAGKAT